jgi:hypothetical protein
MMNGPDKTKEKSFNDIVCQIDPYKLDLVWETMSHILFRIDKESRIVPLIEQEQDQHDMQRMSQ